MLHAILRAICIPTGKTWETQNMTSTNLFLTITRHFYFHLSDQRTLVQDLQETNFDKLISPFQHALPLCGHKVLYKCPHYISYISYEYMSYSAFLELELIWQAIVGLLLL